MQYLFYTFINDAIFTIFVCDAVFTPLHTWFENLYIVQ